MNEHDRQIAELKARMRNAAELGQIYEGELVMDDSSPEERAEERAEFKRLITDFAKNQAGGSNTVSVTLRMPPEMVDRLRYEARHRGFRGYQTLMKEWIRQRLEREDEFEAGVRSALEPMRYAFEMLEARLGQVGGHPEGYTFHRE